MPLREVRPGLRVINKSQNVSKVTIHVPAGDELEVSEYVAGQLAAQNQDFAEVGTEAAGRALPYPPPVEATEEPTEEVAEPVKPRPRKRTPRKS